MFSSLCFGFFDADALRRHELVVRRPLDLDVTARLFAEYGSYSLDQGGCVEGHRFLVHPEGFVESADVLAGVKVIDFVARLVRETGCEIAAVQFGGTLSLPSVVANWEALAGIYAPLPAQPSLDAA